MRQILLLAFLFTSISAFSQGRSEPTTGTTAKIDAPTATVFKHDTVNVIVRQYFDTIKVKIYYEEKEYIRVALGFEIRKIETTSSKPGGGTILDVKLFDDKLKRFTKTLFTVSQIL